MWVEDENVSQTDLAAKCTTPQLLRRQVKQRVHDLTCHMSQEHIETGWSQNTTCVMCHRSMVRQGGHQVELVIEQLLSVGATVQLGRQAVVGVEPTTSNIQPNLAHCSQQHIGLNHGGTPW